MPAPLRTLLALPVSIPAGPDAAPRLAAYWAERCREGGATYAARIFEGKQRLSGADLRGKAGRYGARYNAVRIECMRAMGHAMGRSPVAQTESGRILWAWEV